jgi:hypothetical protein
MNKKQKVEKINKQIEIPLNFNPSKATHPVIHNNTDIDIDSFSETIDIVAQMMQDEKLRTIIQKNNCLDQFIKDIHNMRTRTRKDKRHES